MGCGGSGWCAGLALMDTSDAAAMKRIYLFGVRMDWRVKVWPERT
jgi:hypothetical protein